MALQTLTFFILLLGCVCAAPSKEPAETQKVEAFQTEVEDKDDLKTEASSSYVQRSYDTGYPSGYSGYGVTGYGSLDNYYSGNGYDNSYGYNNGYNGYSGYSGSGYGRYGGNGLTGYGSNGGYGGWGGNGGYNSYYGYNNPYYQGNYHLGYGYYNNRRPGAGYGNIYNNGITPSLVTGYRGYSRR